MIDETLDPAEDFVSLAQPREKRSLAGCVVVISGAGLSAAAAIALSQSFRDAGATVREAAEHFRVVAAASNHGALRMEEMVGALKQMQQYEPPAHVVYQGPPTGKRKAQWKQERRGYR